MVVVDNPWWAIYSQQCPQCKTQQARFDSTHTCLSGWLSGYLSIYLYACLPASLSACLPTCLPINLLAFLPSINLLFSHHHKLHLQIPRIDINAPSNAIELDPNVSALYGEGVADSSDECEEGSVGEEEVLN